MGRRFNTTFKTLAGNEIDVLNPRTVVLSDVALGLSRMPRFAGQTPKPYSVAQHCLLVASLCNLKIYGLLHDAQEWVLCDLPTPVKVALRITTPAYDFLEDKMYGAICKTVGVPVRWPGSVKVADDLAYRMEVEYFREGKKPSPELAAVLKLKDAGRKWLTEVETYVRKSDQTMARDSKRGQSRNAQARQRAEIRARA